MSDWRNPPPKTKYRMFYAGEWRPVIQMLDANNVPTTLVLRAARAALYVSHDNLVAVAVGTADLMENDDYRTSSWDTETVEI
jgi:hypothetical protein